ncbi:MAG: DNA mismatch repair endonuclease MutL [Clostridia bacterium]|nr:DNA mismatch repair endonuclease MutL [Clostridia bacterium]
MQKINLLDSSIYNRISAGEVVERPSSVVKELIENCLDAKATFITIEIKLGGTKLIKISDNGSGIDFLDLKKAFLPHATSKISTVDDLDSIATLGFRGEALASIAAVSKVEMFSKTVEAEVGGKIIIEGGAFGEITEYGCANGTTILVKDLFYNTPARLKFLKSNKQEESSITNIINRLMLANPNVAFKYIVDDKIIYNSTTKGLKEKIYTIYGKQFVENLIDFSCEKLPYKINGYISLPTFCKSNKTYQTLIVNGRYVSNNLISVAISNAYENFLMKGKFPIFILNFELSYQDIDVNVHPSKMEVKFKDSKEIYNLFYSSILETLNQHNCPIDFSFNNEKQFENQEEDSKEEKTDTELKKIEGGFSFSALKNLSEELRNINVSAPKYVKEDIAVMNTSDNGSLITKSTNNTNNNFEKVDMQKNLFDDEIVINKVVKQDRLDKDEVYYKQIGSLFNTYIIIENEENAYIIDQHAGHERLLYDKLIAQFETNKLISQPLLIPYVFSVNEIEDEVIENSHEVFNSLGFEIENFGRQTYKINSIPNILSNINLDEFVSEILSNTTKISNTNENIKNYFATIACKAAVKGGQQLSKEEIDILIKQIFNNKTTLLCPHGRPICVKLTKYEVEKMFKRIV